MSSGHGDGPCEAEASGSESEEARGASPRANIPPAGFVFCTCQVGAEGALKAEIARNWPEWRFSYSRPGFLTFKAPAATPIPDEFSFGAALARATARSLGKASGEAAACAAEVWKVCGALPVEALHVWPRDARPAGDRGFEPAISPEAVAARQAMLAARPADVAQALVSAAGDEVAARAPCEAGKLVLDVVLAGPEEWWVGVHRAGRFESRWPGGIFDTPLPPHAVSRAYLKMAEALAWSGFALGRGQRVAEIGCAPGGSSQALLDRGLEVLGIDPAEVDPRVAAHPKFHFLRMRGADARLREFRKVRWLACDMNVAPRYTLDTAERIAMWPENELRGVLLTLKIPDWSLVAELPGWLARVRSWGFAEVRARQLTFNRQEICVAARR